MAAGRVRRGARTPASSNWPTPANQTNVVPPHEDTDRVRTVPGVAAEGGPLRILVEEVRSRDAKEDLGGSTSMIPGAEEVHSADDEAVAAVG